jgi:hypothetical protein
MMQTLFPSLPGERSESAEEGKAFHAVAAHIISTFVTPNTDTPLSSDLVGTLSENGVLITDEMYQAAVDYTTDVFKYANRHGCMRDVKIEQHVSLDMIYPGMYGYIDAHVYNPLALELVVWEAKYGHGIVDAFENWQLLCYVEGLLEHYRIDGVTDQMLTVRMRVVQPRAYHSDGPCREWSCKASELRGYMNKLKTNAELSNDADAKCKSGLWCKNCSGRIGCETLQRNVYSAIDYSGAATSVTPLTGHSLSTELSILRRASKLIEARLTGLEEQALGEIKSGTLLPGFAAKQGYGRKRWQRDISQDEVIMMGDLMGVDLRKPRELDTPAKCLNKGVDESVIEMYSETPMTALKLVTDNGTKARQVFKSK